jgi:hypothetical protein
MQLSYRGQSYEAYFPTIEMTETPETGTFMGQPYSLKQYQVECPPQAPEELFFMGQSYVRSGNSEPQAYKPRPGEKAVNGRRLLQMRRGRGTGRCHHAFRGS